MKKAIQLLTAGALAGVILTGISAAAAVDYAELQPDYGVRVLEKMSAETFTDASGTVLNYRLYKSPAYSADDKNKPATLFVFLHGSGGRGSDNEQQIKDQSALVNYLVSDSADTLLADMPFVVIAPQCPEDAQWVDTAYSTGSYSTDDTPISTNLKAVYELVLDLLKNENIDKNNVMLSGISMGGYGTWDLALRFPETFNSIVPICGGGDPTKASALKDIRIWAFHCDGDKSVPVAGSRDMIAALEEAGIEAKYTEFDIDGHNAWKPALEDVKDPYMIEWLLEGIRYHIQIESEGEGTVSESKTLGRGESMSVDIVPAEGYQLASLYVDGVLAEATEGKYVFENVTASHTLKAVFEEIPKEKGLSTAQIIAIIGGIVAALTASGVAVTTAIVAKAKKK